MLTALGLLALGWGQPAQKQIELPRLRVSENRRFLVTEGGKHFFWLGDTAWELFHRLSREEATLYLQNRAEKGFTVVQAVALSELDGLTTPNRYGHLPLHDLDPLRPWVVPGPRNDYWDHVDTVIAEANRRGIRVALLPTWGRYWHDPEGNGKPVFNPQNAEAFGNWIGARYRDRGIVWVLGGDRTVDNDVQRATIRAMAKGLREGDGGRHLITFHPRGGGSAFDQFRSDDWLDFGMRQNGHGANFWSYQNTERDYAGQPVKPVLDGEPIYEGHPIEFNAPDQGYSLAIHVRRATYWDLFLGAFGHTYGHHSVWQMFSDVNGSVNQPIVKFPAALDAPGAGQQQWARRLLESRPFLTRVPDNSFIVANAVSSLVPGAGRYQFVGTRDQAGTYAMVYVPAGHPFEVRLGVIRAKTTRAWWYDPRTGKASSIGTFSTSNPRRFESPNPGEELDWVLVLDDPGRGYPPPGSKVWPD